MNPGSAIKRAAGNNPGAQPYGQGSIAPLTPPPWSRLGQQQAAAQQAPNMEAKSIEQAHQKDMEKMKADTDKIRQTADAAQQKLQAENMNLKAKLTAQQGSKAVPLGGALQAALGRAKGAVGKLMSNKVAAALTLAQHQDQPADPPRSATSVETGPPEHFKSAYQTMMTSRRYAPKKPPGPTGKALNTMANTAVRQMGRQEGLNPRYTEGLISRYDNAAAKGPMSPTERSRELYRQGQRNSQSLSQSTVTGMRNNLKAKGVTPNLEVNRYGVINRPTPQAAPQVTPQDAIAKAQANWKQYGANASPQQLAQAQDYAKAHGATFDPATGYTFPGQSQPSSAASATPTAAPAQAPVSPDVTYQGASGNQAPYSPGQAGGPQVPYAAGQSPPSQATQQARQAVDALKGGWQKFKDFGTNIAERSGFGFITDGVDAPPSPTAMSTTNPDGSISTPAPMADPRPGDLGAGMNPSSFNTKEEIEKALGRQSHLYAPQMKRKWKELQGIDVSDLNPDGTGGGASGETPGFLSNVWHGNKDAIGLGDEDGDAGQYWGEVGDEYGRWMDDPTAYYSELDNNLGFSRALDSTAVGRGIHTALNWTAKPIFTGANQIAGGLAGTGRGIVRGVRGQEGAMDSFLQGLKNVGVGAAKSTFGIASTASGAGLLKNFVAAPAVSVGQKMLGPAFNAIAKKFGPKAAENAAKQVAARATARQAAGQMASQQAATAGRGSQFTGVASAPGQAATRAQQSAHAFRPKPTGQFAPKPGAPAAQAAPVAQTGGQAAAQSAAQTAAQEASKATGRSLLVNPIRHPVQAGRALSPAATGLVNRMNSGLVPGLVGYGGLGALSGIDVDPVTGMPAQDVASLDPYGGYDPAAAPNWDDWAEGLVKEQSEGLEKSAAEDRVTAVRNILKRAPLGGAQRLQATGFGMQNRFPSARLADSQKTFLGQVMSALGGFVSRPNYGAFQGARSRYDTPMGSAMHDAMRASVQGNPFAAMQQRPAAPVPSIVGYGGN